MRKSFLLTIVFAAACLMLCAQETRAQYAYGASGIGYDPNTKIVYGYSRTAVDYWAGAYYDPYVEGYLYDPYQLRDAGYSRGYEDLYDAYVETAAYSSPSTRYDVISDHYVISWYSVSVTVCDYYGFYGGCGYDPYGFGNYFGGYGGGFDYFYGGYGGYVPERTYYLGSTGISGITPSECGGSAAGSAQMDGPGGDVNMAPIDDGGGGDGTGGGGGTYDYDGSSDTSRDYVALAGDSCPLPTNVTIKSLGFKNDWDVKKYTTGEASDPVIAPNNEPTWVSGRDNTGFVVAYTKGASPHMSLTFTVSSAVADTPAKLRVKNGDTVMTTFDINISSNGDVFLSDISLPAQLGDTPQVARAKDYTFKFEYQINGGSWRAAGTATQKIYWTMANPIADEFTNTRGRVHDGLYDLALEKSVGALGEGTADPDAAMSTITTVVAGELFYRPSRPNDPGNPGAGLPGTHPLSVYRRTPMDYQCNDNAQLLRGLFRSAGMDGTFNFYWGGNPSNSAAHWYIQPGTTGDPAFGRTHNENTTARFNRPALSPEGLAALPYFTFHATVTASTPTSTRSYDASYGIIEPEVKLVQAVDQFGACVNGEAANSWRVKSPTWMTLVGDTGYACGTTASTGGTGIPHAASVVSQSVPTYMEAGSSYLVSVTLQNNGDNTWTSADLYRLGSQNPQDNSTWGIGRVEVPQSVAPGQQVTFDFYVTAPYSAGFYNFQWRMVHDGVTWFGDYTPNVQVEVYSPYNSCDPWQEQDCWNRGGSWDSNSCYCQGGWYNY
ncbi:MAG TPA: NBR1-Ig-like domain-containing protein [Pyrinomonadaceae bacterium]|jgi:hypothetical protein|nr:NBR1-Ig-like domain-containing protein [Pyrinomonadaceae bacterium]